MSDAPALPAEPVTGSHPKPKKSSHVTWKALLLMLGSVIGLCVLVSWTFMHEAKAAAKDGDAAIEKRQDDDREAVKEGFRGLNKRFDKQDDRWDRFFGPSPWPAVRVPPPVALADGGTP